MKRIMFNDRYGLTQAVIAGRKTITRRIIDPKQKYSELRWWQPCLELEEGLYGYNDNDGWNMIPLRYHGGEVVAVAQSYVSIHLEMMDGDYGDSIYDSFRCDHVAGKPGWYNKMAARADIMPHLIRITGIRCERLQDISDEDCMKEGIWKAENVGLQGTTYWYSGLVNSDFRTPREAFASLIDKVAGRGTWDQNPWVVVYEFETLIK